MMERVRVALIVIIACSARVVAADPLPGPTWVAGPDKAYNCTHYLDQPSAWKAPPRVNAGEPMKLVMRKGKVMKFTLAAKPVTKGKVTYELETPPPGAKLAGAKFTWTVAGAAGQKLDFALVAVGADGGRTKWPLSVTIADDDLVTAWSAGLGSVWPDCSVYAPASYDAVLDLDGDNKDDVIYRTYAGEDGTMETHVMLQRGNMKFVEVHTCYSCTPSPEVAVDGTHLLLLQESCCCMETGTVYRFDGDALLAVGSWQEPSKGTCNPEPDRGVDVIIDRDAKNRIKAIEMHPERGKVTRYRWSSKTKRFD